MAWNGYSKQEGGAVRVRGFGRGLRRGRGASRPSITTWRHQRTGPAPPWMAGTNWDRTVKYGSELMKKRKAMGLALIAALYSGLFAGSGCLPDNYWVGLAGEVTTGFVTTIVDDFVADSLDQGEPAEAEE